MSSTRCSSTKTVLIVDPLLKDGLGHQAEYARSLANAAQRCGWEVWVVGSRRANVDLLAPHSIERLFEADLAPLTNSRLRFLGQFVLRILKMVKINPLSLFARYYGRGFAGELSRIAAAKVANSRVIAIFPTAFPQQIHGIALWLSRLPKSVDLVAVVIQHSSPSTTNGATATGSEVAVLRSAASFVKKNGLEDKLKLASSSEVVAQNIAAMTGMSCRVVPHPIESNTVSEYRIRNGRRSDLVRVLFAGDARREKGFHLIPDLVKCVSEDSQDASVRWLVQCVVRDHGDLDVADALSKLNNLNHVELLREPLSSEKYFALMAKSDIVVLPYVAQRYKHASSGILPEAIALNKVVIVPQDTWLHSQCARWNASFTTFVSTDKASLVLAVKNAIGLVVDSLPPNSSADDCLAYNNSDNFLKVVGSISGCAKLNNPS